MRMNQITLTVRDYASAVEFYTRLGLLQIVATDHGYARFETETGETLSISTDPDAAPSKTTVYFEVSDVAQKVTDLRAKGLDVDAPPDRMRWLWTEAHLHDPSGNRICIFYAGTNRRFPPWRLDGRRQ
ncbi:VOC family protein [Tateyamaria sp. SN3-11]|uniref:VOC family protein n=1 Tax=Tateyamaria sp. SN3-11 TaxID=3092147 RepID=UPI0039E93A25